MLFRGGARYHVDITSAEYYAGVTRVAECVPPSAPAVRCPVELTLAPNSSVPT